MIHSDLKKISITSIPLSYSISMLVLLIFSLLSEQSIAWRNCHYVVSGISILYLFLQFKEMGKEIQSQYMYWAYGLFAVVYVYAPISAFLSFHVNGIDFSIFDWMTAPKHIYGDHGYEPIHHLNHYSIHRSWILYPIYLLRHIVQSPLFLVAFGGLSIWLAVIPLYFFVREKVPGNLFAHFVCLSYLSSSFTHALLNSWFRMEYFYPLALFTFALAESKRDWKLIFISIVLFLSIKEDAALYMFGYYFAQFFLRGRKKADLLLALSLVVFFMLNVFYIKKLFFAHLENPTYLLFWRHWGESPLSIMSHMVQSPTAVVLSVLQSGWWKVYSIFAFIPFLGAYHWLGFAIPGVFLLGTATQGQVMYNYGQYYPILIFCAALLAVVEMNQDLGKLSFFLQKGSGRKFTLLVLFLYPLFHASTLRLYKPLWREQNEVSAINQYLLTKNQSKQEICIQPILMPYFSKDLRIRPLEKSCFTTARYVIFDPKYDPYPTTKAQLLQWKMDFNHLIINNHLQQSFLVMDTTEYEALDRHGE